MKLLKRITETAPIWVPILLLLGLAFYIGHKNLVKTATADIPREIGVLSLSGEPYSAEFRAINAPTSPELTKSDITDMIRTKASERGLDGDLLVSLATCESGIRQFNDDGSVLRGNVHPYDVGIMQINLNPDKTDWADVAKMTGYDPMEIEGNIDLAMLIAEIQGYEAWVCLSKVN